MNIAQHGTSFASCRPSSSSSVVSSWISWASDSKHEHMTRHDTKNVNSNQLLSPVTTYSFTHHFSKFHSKLQSKKKFNYVSTMCNGENGELELDWERCVLARIHTSSSRCTWHVAAMCECDARNLDVWTEFTWRITTLTDHQLSTQVIPPPTPETVNSGPANFHSNERMNSFHSTREYPISFSQQKPRQRKNVVAVVVVIARRN